ncbi:hypothetical protein MAR_ORF043 [Marseillevirus marseillevirus]|uniref:Peptidase S74 domain-containing protein n=1 Tax=Marseillevirus marseillevirus TaxID=694581 RepID=D2XA55_GBMV|nr:hypothetical protein MAR_ORF043 [Marseillevirus marseillevirus]ADB03832.1 hypothetical protein MAR_ORF043 [Marseillevirus marseillevirus]
MFSFLQKKIQKWYDHKFRNSKGSRRIKKVCGSCCSVFVLLFPMQLLAPLVFDSSSGNVNISTGEAWSASNLLAATETVRGIVFGVTDSNIGERPYEIDGRTDHGVISEEVPEIFATFDERGDRNGANVLLFAVAILSEIQKLQEQVKTLRKQRGL